MKKIIALAAVMLLIAAGVRGQVMWNLRAGVSYWDTSGSDWIDSDDKGVPIMGELGVDVPLPRRFAIEAGVRYKYGYRWAYEDGRDRERRAHMLEIPVLAGYKLPLSSKWWLRLAAGPYVSFGQTYEDLFAYHQAGVATALTAECKHFNVGFNYNIAAHNALPEVMPNAVFFTLGVKFGTSAWKSVGAAALGLGTVATAVAAAATAGRDDGGSYDSSAYTPADDAATPAATPKKDNPKAKALKQKAEEQEDELNYRRFNYKMDERTYTGYEDQLRDMDIHYDNYDHLNSDQYYSRVQELQRKMKQVRERMEAHGVKRTRSYYETWVPDSYKP